MKGIMTGGDLPWKVVTLVRPSNQHKQGLWVCFYWQGGFLGAWRFTLIPFQNKPEGVGLAAGLESLNHPGILKEHFRLQ